MEKDYDASNTRIRKTFGFHIGLQGLSDPCKGLNERIESDHDGTSTQSP